MVIILKSDIYTVYIYDQMSLQLYEYIVKLVYLLDTVARI